MKLHFSKKQSIYNVFKTIKKIPTYKSVLISFVPDHPIYEHTWWAQQLVETIQQYNLDVIVVVHNQEEKAFFTQAGIATQMKHKNIFHKAIQSVHNLVFTTQKLHTDLIFKKSYISYLVIISELGVIITILYFFRGLISPNATIYIQPSRHIESIVYNYTYLPESIYSDVIDNDTLTIPYSAGAVPFHHRLTLNVENIQYETKEASGRVTLFNGTSESVSLLPNTILVNDDGITFKTDARVTIPPGNPAQPGKIDVDVRAEKIAENGMIVGELGNITQDSVLYVKKLPESMESKLVYATAKRSFAGGVTLATGSVIANDIENIEQRLLSYMEDKKKEVLQTSIIEKDHFILLYDDFIDLVIEEFVTTSHIGDTTSFIEGEVHAHITYAYIKKKDLLNAVNMYSQQRISNSYTLINHDDNSLTLYDMESLSGDVFSIPTKLNAIRGYNFTKDPNKLIPELQAKIAGKTAKEVKNILLEYEEIDDVEVNISPPWYNTLPSILSRISFQVRND